MFRSIARGLVILSTAALPLTAQQTLTLSNGDRITGTLKSISGGNWVFTHAGGDLTIPASDIAGFESNATLGLRLADGTIGASAVTAAPGGLGLQFQDGPRTVAPTDLAAVGDPNLLERLQPVRIGFLSPITRFWGANLSFGFSDKSGNSRARGLSGTAELRRRTPKDRLTFGFGFNREQSEAVGGTLETTVSKYYGSARLDVFVISRLFVFGSTRQERDRFQDIALRSTYNFGVGFQAVSLDRTDLSFSFAGGARREDFVTAASATATQTVAALGSVFRHDFGPAVLAWNVDFSPTTDDLEDFRLLTDINVTAPLFFGIGFRLGVLNEHTSRPPAGVEKNDLLVTTNLSYTIGR